MIGERELIAATRRLEVHILHEWIELGLVKPLRGESEYLFDEADVARVQLACDLCFDMGIGHEALPVILALVDQLHRTRHSLRALSAAVGEQPDHVKEEIHVSIRRRLRPQDPA